MVENPAKMLNSTKFFLKLQIASYYYILQTKYFELLII